MVFYKSRDSVLDWVVSNKTIGGTYTLYLNLTNGQDSTTGTYNSTLPTSTVLHVGTAPYANTSGDDFVAYAFHSVEGYSKIGSYTGNGSTDGTFVYTGFRPAFVLLKRTDTSAHWVLMDSVSDPYNPIDSALLPAGTNGSGTGYTVDFLSNGFKLRLTGSAMNANGATHIYIAFAEQPFKFSNAR